MVFLSLTACYLALPALADETNQHLYIIQRAGTNAISGTNHDDIILGYVPAMGGMQFVISSSGDAFLHRLKPDVRVVAVYELDHAMQTNAPLEYKEMIMMDSKREPPPIESLPKGSRIISLNKGDHVLLLLNGTPTAAMTIHAEWHHNRILH